MSKTVFNPAIIPQLKILLSQGSTPVQLCAHLHIAKNDLLEWLSLPGQEYDELRKEFEIGMTAFEAHWEKIGQRGITGDYKVFREATYKSFMQHNFNWADKTETTSEVKKPEQLLTDDELQKQIDKYLEATKRIHGIKSPTTTSDTGEGSTD